MARAIAVILLFAAATAATLLFLPVSFIFAIPIIVVLAFIGYFVLIAGAAASGEPREPILTSRRRPDGR